MYDQTKQEFIASHIVNYIPNIVMNGNSLPVILGMIYDLGYKAYSQNKVIYQENTNIGIGFGYLSKRGEEIFDCFVSNRDENLRVTQTDVDVLISGIWKKLEPFKKHKRK